MLVQYGYVYHKDHLPVVLRTLPRQAKGEHKAKRVPFGPKVMAVQIGPVVEGFAAPIPHNGCWINFEASFKHRMNGVRGRKRPRRMRSFIRASQRFIRKHITRGCCSSPLSYEEWIETCKSYSRARKNQLAKVKESCEVLDLYTVGVELSEVKGFIKVEFYNGYKPPRGIYSRLDMAKVLFGPWVRVLEDVLYAFPEYVKNVAAKDLAQHVEDHLGVRDRYYVVDATSWESSMTNDILVGIWGYLLSWVGMPEEIIAAIAGVNRIKWKSGSSEIRGRTMSGEMDTSVRNGFINWMLCRFACMYAGDHKARVIVEGDDCLIGTSAILTEDIFRDLGFDVEIKSAGSPGELGFCQYYWDEDRTQLLSPFYMLKVGWSDKYRLGMPDRIATSLYLAKLMSMSYYAPKCPIFWKLMDNEGQKRKGQKAWFYRDYWGMQTLKTLGIKVKDRGYQWIRVPFKLNPEVGEPSEKTRKKFEQIFGISVDDQYRVERDLFKSEVLKDWLASNHPDTSVCWNTDIHRVEKNKKV